MSIQNSGTAIDPGNDQFAAQEDWYRAHPECDFPTDDCTDEAIGRILDARQIRRFGPDGIWFDGTSEEFRAAVMAGMDAWYAEVSQ